MVEEQLDDGGASREVAADIDDANFDTGEFAPIAVRFNDHRDRPIRTRMCLVYGEEDKGPIKAR
jgi:hypothetical protein